MIHGSLLSAGRAIARLAPFQGRSGGSTSWRETTGGAAAAGRAQAARARSSTDPRIALFTSDLDVLAGEVLVAVRGANHVVFDAHPAERQQAVDQRQSKAAAWSPPRCGSSSMGMK